MKKNGFKVLWATFLCLSLHFCCYAQAENQQEKDYVGGTETVIFPRKR